MPDYDPDEGTAAADLFRFLSACYYEPTPAFAEEHLFESLRIAAGRVDAALAVPARGLGEAFASDDLQALLVDYTRLFLGPVQPLARPYGSFWQTGETMPMQDRTLAVVALYRQGGFEIDEEFHELPDHVAVELEFLYLLNFKLAGAERCGDHPARRELVALRQRFLAEHLGAWVGGFAAAVRQGAQTDFYRQLAALTEGCVQRGSPPRVGL